jgi:hypothetical protein
MTEGLKMARLTLQFDTVVVVPICAPWRQPMAWCLRSLTEAELIFPEKPRGRSALDGDNFGGNAPRAVTLHRPAPCPTGAAR